MDTWRRCSTGEVVELEDPDGQTQLGIERYQTVLIKLESNLHTYDYEVTSKARIKSLKKDGVNQPTPDLVTPEHPSEAIYRPEEMRYSPAPTDTQLNTALLVYVSVNIDPHRIPQKEWEGYADYRGNPLPGAFRNGLRENIERLAGTTLPNNAIEVVLEDRPPRSDGLFPSYFVDLSDAIIYLRQTVPSEVVSALVGMAVQALVTEVRSKLPGKKLPDGALNESFSPATLELLCVNYAMLDKQPGEPYTVEREPFNTKFEGGYHFAVDDTLPMGWRISVGLPDQTHQFIVDAAAHVVQLNITKGDESHQVSNASLMDPESTRAMLVRFEPNIRPDQSGERNE